MEALKLFPSHSTIHLKYAGFVRHVRGDIDRAGEHYKKAVKCNPQNVDALGGYASFLHGTNSSSSSKKIAEELYNSAIELDNTHVNNLCNFGLFLSEELQQYNKAESMYK
jgi:Tfp pilus assembly protein PilF